MINTLSNIQQLLLNQEAKNTKWPSICYIMLASFLHTICSSFTKLIPSICTFQLVYFRSLIMLLLNTILVINLNVPIYKISNKILKTLIWRSLFGGLGTLFFYEAFKYIAVSEGIVIFKTSPLWTALMAIFYLRVEKFSLKLFGNFGLCLSGIILITQPPQLQAFLGKENIEYSEDHLKGVILMLIGSILGSIIQVLINSLGGKVNQLVILQYFSFISIIITTLPLFVIQSQQWIVPNSYELMILLIMGIFSFLSQLLMNRAYLIGQLTQISMLGQTQVIYAYFFDVIIGEQLTIMSVIGTIIITTSLILVVKAKKQQ